MSTRRARIKAVASLPVRRKNQDNIKKQNSPKQLVEKTLNTEEDAKNDTPSGPNVIEKITVATFENNPTNAKITPEAPPKSPETPKKRKQGTPQRVPSPRLVRPSPVYRLPPSPLVTHNYDAHTLNKPPTPAKNDDKVNHVQETQASRVAPQSVEAILKNKDDDIDGIDKIPDYNPPSIPESIEENVLDGIVPLQTTRNVPKPLDLLKNELISDNAEVLFDPIVPLPSPSKVRPKLRPVPRLAFRRNSVQGSASESEDESRRALLSAGATTPGPPRQRHDSHASHTTQFTVPNREVTRVRNDSVCSVMSQQAPQTVLSASSSSYLLKDKHAAVKSRRTDLSRRMSAMRRRQRRERNAPRDALTMYDLIFYNPTTNPIVPEEPAKGQEEILPIETNNQNAVTEETVDDPPPKQDSAPVPQIKLGPNGEIILDEKSLVIEQTENQRKLSSSLVVEGGGAGTLGGGGRYSRAPRSADWTDAETVRFYRALAAIGTDFTLMKPLFPDRSRRDLKVKFKKEEKLNGAQVDKALRSQTQWDALTLQNEFAEERKKSAEKAAQNRAEFLEQKRIEKARIKAAKEEGVKQSRGTKAMESSYEQERNTANELIKRAMESETRTKLAKKVNKKLQNQKFATLTPLNGVQNTPPTTSNVNEMVHITKLPQVAPKPLTPNLILPNVPKNIETGSLVVLTVNDPKEPSKKILQTYISHSSGQLTPVALPGSLLNSVMSYMKKGTPKRGLSSNSSPQLTSPSSIASQDSRSSVIQINPSPSKRIRQSSFSITEL